MTDSQRLDKIIELLTAMATQPFGPLPAPKKKATPKAKTRDPRAEVEASNRNFQEMMTKRRMALGINVPEDEAEEGYENTLPPSGGTMHPDEFWGRRRGS